MQRPQPWLPGQLACARCGTQPLMLCACESPGLGKDVVFVHAQPLPEDATAQQRMERWAANCANNPAANVFDAHRFVADMLARGLVGALER